MRRSAFRIKEAQAQNAVLRAEPETPPGCASRRRTIGGSEGALPSLPRTPKCTLSSPVPRVNRKPRIRE